MNRTAPRIAYFGCFLTGALALGCGGSSAKKMMTYADASGFDTGSSTAGAGGDGGVDAGAAGADAAGPVASAGSKLIIGGDIQLIGSGPDTCTSQVPATTDRWCGFVKPASTLGNFELWVVNVSKIAANVTVKCDTTDQNCLRLSTGLYEDTTNGFRIDGFNGDTLTYSEVPTLSADGFIGPISAWRPGWTGGRRVTSTTGVFCNGTAASNAVICIENPATDADMNTTAELHAGTLDDQSGGTLPLVDSLLVFASADATGVQKWSANLTPDGKSVAWSTRVLPTDTENLKVQSLAAGSSPVAVATDASQWIVTSDSSSWLWLKGYNYDQTGAPSGTLQSAPYSAATAPLAASVKTLAAGVGDFNQAAAGVLYRTQVASNQGTLILQTSRDGTATGSMIDQDVYFVFEITQDGKSFSYTKNVMALNAGTAMPIPIFDLYVANGVTTPCVLESMATAIIPPNFLSAGDIAAWGSFNTVTGEVAGEYTTIGNCTTRKFASDVSSWTAIADEGFVYVDTLDPDPSVDEGTLRYGKVMGGLLPATGTPIQTRAALTFATLLPSLPAVVYTVETGTTGSDGLYVNATLPFSSTAPSTDGGTPDATTDAGSDAATGSDVGTTEGGSETGASDAGADADAG